MNPYRGVVEWLRDSTIGFLLIVGGVALAEIVHACFGWQLPLMVAAGLFPFLWFAKKKGVMAFDFVDGIAWLTYVVVMGCVLSCPWLSLWLRGLRELYPSYGVLVFALSVLAPIWLYRAGRRICTIGLGGARAEAANKA
jgi:hypothetical protein